MYYLYAAAGSILILFILRIAQKKDKNRADYLLIAINVTIGVFLISDVMVQELFSSASIILQNSIPLLLFPLFSWYVLQFIYHQKKIPKGWLLTFLPGVLFIAYSVVDHFALTEYTEETLRLHYVQPTSIYQFFFKSNQLLFIGILIWLLIQVRTFEKDLKDGYSNIETISLDWLQHFIWIYLISISLTFLLFSSQNLGLLPLDIPAVFGIVYGLLILSIFYLNYQGIQHYTLNQALAPSKIITSNEKSDNAQKSSSEKNAKDQQILMRIEDWMETNTAYLNPTYGLKDLSKDLDISTHSLSRAINQQTKHTFYDLINGYRVKHLKNLMQNPQSQRFTILALGYESGFNSKASLNRIFKQVTGLTPKAYLKSIQSTAI